MKKGNGNGNGKDGKGHGNDDVKGKSKPKFTKGKAPKTSRNKITKSNRKLSKERASQLLYKIKENCNKLYSILRSQYPLVGDFYYRNGWESLGYESFYKCIKAEIKSRSVATLFRIKDHIDEVRESFPKANVFDISQAAACALRRIKDDDLKQKVIDACMEEVDDDLGKITKSMVEDYARDIDRERREQEAREARRSAYDEEHDAIKRTDPDESEPRQKPDSGTKKAKPEKESDSDTEKAKPKNSKKEDEGERPVGKPDRNTGKDYDEDSEDDFDQDSEDDVWADEAQEIAKIIYDGYESVGKKEISQLLSCVENHFLRLFD